MARIQKDNEEHLYRIYVTDALQGIADNTSVVHGGYRFKNRWVDIINHNVDARSADEIVEDVLKKSGLEVID